MTSGWRFGFMRRWARTRFMPDDCGLKPPIETLPQIAQERAMLSLEIGRVVEVRFGPERGRAGIPGRKAREGRYDSTRVARHATGPADPALREDARGVPNEPTTPTPGRSLVSRRAIIDVVRSATLGSYGVIGFAGGGLIGRIADRL